MYGFKDLTDTVQDKIQMVSFFVFLLLLLPCHDILPAEIQAQLLNLKDKGATSCPDV